MSNPLETQLIKYPQKIALQKKIRGSRDMFSIIYVSVFYVSGGRHDDLP